MENKKSKGFFCVVYFTDTKKTCYYRKVWQPSKLADALMNWKWIKVFVSKEDYFANTQGKNYLCIFDDENPVSSFTYQRFLKK